MLDHQFDHDNLTKLLEAKFGFNQFRNGQDVIIESVLRGQDTLAVMPTGGGKSLCYQLPALALGKLVIVVSPLIALMRDQVRLLQAKGIPSGCLHSGQSMEEKQQIFGAMKKGGAFVLYLSPERVQKPGFETWIKSREVGLIAIDEAHCVSQWGPDFRPDYAKLSLIREWSPKTPILALTASATPIVLDDIVDRLRLREPQRVVRGFYRSNLFFQVDVCDDDDRKQKLIRNAIRKTPEGRVLIYCGTRNGAEELSNSLAGEFDKVGFYHAGLSTAERSETQKKIETGELRIVCATNAFGMGVDYPNVRLVAHFQMPANIESFYQEMGRAGRDGKPSRCILLYSKRDKGLQSFFIQQSKAEPRVISSKWRALEAMVAFSEGGECRHAGLLIYFKDAQRLKKCGHCDICVPDQAWRVPIETFQPATRVRKKKSNPVHVPTTGAAAFLYDERSKKLRAWRKKYAEERELPAFMIFSDRTLSDLITRMPNQEHELQNVYGLGPQKIQAFGKELLSVLSEIDRS